MSFTFENKHQMKKSQLLFILLFSFCLAANAQITLKSKEVLDIPKLNFVDSLEIWKKYKQHSLYLKPNDVPQNFVRKSKLFIEFGVNLSRVSRSLNDKDNQIDSIGPGSYLFSLKLHKGEHAIRFGTGFSINKNIKPLEGAPNSSRANSAEYWSFRLGYEKQFRINPGRWTLGFGGDVFVANKLERALTITTIDEVTTEKEYKAIGIGPIVTLQWNAGRNVSFGVELAAYYTKGTFYSRTKLKVDNFLDKTTKIDQPTSWKVNSPNSVFIFFRF